MIVDDLVVEIKVRSSADADQRESDAYENGWKEGRADQDEALAIARSERDRHLTALLKRNWSTCPTCGVPVFRQDLWSHQGGTPPTDHEAQPESEDA